MSIIKFIAWLIMFVGGLIALLSGGCGVALTVSGGGFEPIMLLFAGVPLAFGLLIAFGGYCLLDEDEK